MSFLTKLKKTAENVARNQLNKLGITLPANEMPEDDDTADRDIVDIYCDIVQKTQAGSFHADPIAPEMRETLSQNIMPLCGSNEMLKDTVRNWLDHRDETRTEEPLPATPEILRGEALDMLRAASVIQTPSENWEEALMDAARAQFRPVINLIHQMARQFSSDQTTEWLPEVNRRLARYRLAVIRIGKDAVSIADSKTAKKIQPFWAES